jgi:hypothetical protein
MGIPHFQEKQVGRRKHQYSYDAWHQQDINPAFHRGNDCFIDKDSDKVTTVLYL